MFMDFWTFECVDFSEGQKGDFELDLHSDAPKYGQCAQVLNLLNAYMLYGSALQFPYYKLSVWYVE